MSAIRAVLFDMDGVIFDSERSQLGCWLELAERMGLREMERVYRRCLGVTYAVTGGILCEEYGRDFDWQGFRREAKALYLARCGGGRMPLKPGAREAIARLRSRGLLLALASSTERELVERWLVEAGLREAFPVVVTGDEVLRSKPAPDIFLLAAERLGAQPEHCAVIEDSFNGVRAAHAANMRPLMVPDLLEPDGEIRSLAEAVLPDLAAAAAWIEERQGPCAQAYSNMEVSKCPRN